MVIKIRRLKLLPKQEKEAEVSSDEPRTIRVKNNVSFKVDERYLREVEKQAQYDEARRDHDRQASMELAGMKYAK